MTHSHWMFPAPTESGKTTALSRYAGLLLSNYRDCSMVLIDSKAADNLHPESVKAADREVEQFTTTTGKSTRIFNPFGQLFWQQSAILDRATYLCDSLGLSYGTDYGKGWFASAIAVLCLKAVESGVNITNLNNLKDIVLARMDDRSIPKKTRADAPGLWNKLLLLGCLDMLNSTEKPTADVRELFGKPTVWTFHLPALGGAGSWNADVARMLLYAILSEAQRREQQIESGKSISSWRSFRRLSPQTWSEFLNRQGAWVLALFSALKGCRISARSIPTWPLLSIRTPECAGTSACATRSLSGISLHERRDGRILHSHTSGHRDGPTHTQSQFIAPRMNVNEIRDMTDDPHMSIIDIAQGDGFAQYSGLPFFLPPNTTSVFASVAPRKRALARSRSKYHHQ